MPRVSILLTCYNYLKYLPACVEGIRAQTFQDFEVIALDDGSKDGTREWLKENCPDFRLEFNEKNLGTYGTLNKGLDLAQGEFIAVLNDDDVWGPEKLQKQVEMMDANPKMGLVHTGGIFIDGDGVELEDKKPLGFTFPNTPSGDLLKLLTSHNQIINSAVLVRRECFDKLGKWDASFYGCGDWHMWLRIAIFYHIGYVPGTHTYYRVHGTNACLDIPKMLDDEFRIKNWMAEWGTVYKSELKRNASLRDVVYGKRDEKSLEWAKLGTERAMRQDMKGAREAYWNSIKLTPLRLRSYGRVLMTFFPYRLFKQDVAESRRLASESKDRLLAGDRAGAKNLLREAIRAFPRRPKNYWQLLVASVVPIGLLQRQHESKLVAIEGTKMTWDGDARGGRDAYMRSIKIYPLRVKSYLRYFATFLPKGAFKWLR